MNLQEAARMMTNARSTMTDGAFQQAGGTLGDNRNDIREKIQEETSSAIEGIISKLRSGEPISADETAFIRLWIVGDAESYARMENNFQDWVREYERLETTLIRYADSECSVEDLFQLQGILDDATRVSYDIALFLESKERISKFESAVSDGLDKAERDVLAKILTDKLRSPKY